MMINNQDLLKLFPTGLVLLQAHESDLTIEYFHNVLKQYNMFFEETFGDFHPEKAKNSVILESYTEPLVGVLLNLHEYTISDITYGAYKLKSMHYLIGTFFGITHYHAVQTLSISEFDRILKKHIKLKTLIDNNEQKEFIYLTHQINNYE